MILYKCERCGKVSGSPTSQWLLVETARWNDDRSDVTHLCDECLPLLREFMAGKR